MIFMIAVVLFLIFLSTVSIAGHLFSIVKQLQRIATVLEHSAAHATLKDMAGPGRLH